MIEQLTDIPRTIVLTERGPVDAVVGYRSWLVKAVDGVARLQSVYQVCTWPIEGPLEAQGRLNFSLLPDEHSCTIRKERIRDFSAEEPYGIYAWDDPYGTYAWYELHWCLATAPVSGEVALWGKIIQHERGYRAQYARPLSLFVTSDTGPARCLTELAALAYDIPLVRLP